MGGDSQELGDYFFESVLRVPANCLGFQTLSVGQLKVVQQPLKLDYPQASCYLRSELSILCFGRS